ncbi:molybdenum cofactor biosynthesis protein MoaE [Aciditerrimonas ferrireducens]|uniref:molybdenum cofactor biosynthesis protein MoaE n=1 Tax=Aciditerrimonas ferrireducens TaxID=667306 RepID=UPI002005BF13|nr:molybdenum cofactor biosynthesis protein MoaE [Aciditerrimonas ferrireducens]MCK4177498.1 molybdenum cofactor biosynthesis protein MoaE [Aciditerrimonas ferrireducens]
MVDPPAGDTWVRCTRDPLAPGEAASWAVTPSCGGLVLFMGTVRDHAEGRPGVTEVAYEAYEEQVEPALWAVATEARRRWPELGRLVLQHRIGPLAVGEASVLVVATAPHRPEAFVAGRFLIDAIKRTVPIWKRESWAGGVDWGSCAEELTTPDAVPSPPRWPAHDHGPHHADDPHHTDGARHERAGTVSRDQAGIGAEARSGRGH